VLRYVQPTAAALPLLERQPGRETRYTTDGTGRQRGADLFLSTEFQLRTFDYFAVNLNASATSTTCASWSSRGWRCGGPAATGGEAWLSTTTAGFLAEGGVGAGRTLARGPLPATGFWGSA